MKKLAVLVALLTANLFAADIAGKWKGTAESQNGPLERTFTFKVDGSTLTVERLRLAFPSPLPVAFGESPELHQSGLLRVQFQSDLPQLLLQFPAPDLRFSNPRTASSAYRTMITSPRAASARPPPRDPARNASRRWPAAARSTIPAACPPSVAFHSPSSITPAFSHLRIRRSMRGSAIRCSTGRKAANGT